MEDRYELRGKIGQGGIGRVHRAFDHRMKREVAIKRILTSEDDPTLADEATKQLLVEAGALASLQHPNIVTIHDVGADDLGPYVVMELISGRTLDDIIEDAPLTWDDFKIVSTQSLEALIAAQELNMIHSDLKPPNIMLTWLPSGTFQVKIVDFGLAILIQNQSPEEIAAMDSVFGSVFFMPPEQFERKPLDTRSDLYSLGCCLYQALAGTYPFNGTTGAEVMDAHLNHQVTPLQEMRADIPIWACQWIMWLINRNPEDRPESAREALANFIQNVKDSNPTLSQGSASSTRSKLIIPGSISATGLVPTVDSHTGPQTSNVAISSRTQLPATGSVATSTTAQTTLQDGEENQEPSFFEKFRKPIIYGGIAAGIALLAVLIVLLVNRTKRIKLENTYSDIVNRASSYNVREVRITATQLEIILNQISTLKDKGDLTPAYNALFKAQATDGTDIEAKLVEFVTKGAMPDKTKEGIFTEVLAKRRRPELVPKILDYSATVSNGDIGLAAFEAIRPMIREDQAEKLLELLSKAKSEDVQEAIEAKMEDIIESSRNRNGLASQISKAKESASAGANPALSRLQELCNPGSQTNNQNNKPPGGSSVSNPKPNPKPKPPINPPPNKPATGGSTDFSKLRDMALGGGTQQKFEAIEKLSKIASEESHRVLMHPAGSVSDDAIRGKAISALVNVNSTADLLSDEGQARQRWLQVVWRCKNDDETKAVLDRLIAIDKPWADEILLQQAEKGDGKYKGYIRSKKADIF